MTYSEAKEMAFNGKPIRREVWNEAKHIYFLSNQEFSKAFGYGTGDEGDTTFIGKYVLHSASGNLHVGWRPSKQDRESNDWETLELED